MLLLPGGWAAEDVVRPRGGSGGAGLVAGNPRGVSEPELDVCCKDETLHLPTASRKLFCSGNRYRTEVQLAALLQVKKFSAFIELGGS
jgi:hypothetical protein